MKTYQLPLTRNYVRNWTAVEAIRELLQNNIDYGHGKLTAVVKGDAMAIFSEGAKLEARTLLLGCTSKADDNESIGSFGEGYKIAMLVLAREGVGLTVFNNGVKWTPRLTACAEFQGEEVLFVDEAPYNENEKPADGVTFFVSGLSPEVVAAVIENTLHLQADIGRTRTVTQGDILFAKPGKLYVNGLFVADTGLEYGYNVKPEFLKLERDRQTVSSFDLKFLTKNMWFETNDYDAIAEMMEKGIEDVEYAEYGCPELVKEACYRTFVNKHPGAVVAKSQSALEALVKEGMVEVKVYPAAFAGAVSSHPSYGEGVIKTAKVTPQMELKNFLKDQRKNMNRKSISALNDLIKKASVWR